MRVVDSTAVEDVTHLFSSISEARASFQSDDVILEAPDYVKTGFTWDGHAWQEPFREGFAYDSTTDTFYPHDEYRHILHNRTSDDTLQALRKIREGDTSMDWQAWLDKLDAYNMAVEKTKEQTGYPITVEWPEYPTKP